MEKVILYHTADEPLYCPFCGKLTMPRKKPFDETKNGCPHLLYIGCTEGEGMLTYSRKGIEPLLEAYEESEDEDDLINMAVPNAVHFSLCWPPPSCFGEFIGYAKYPDELSEVSS